MSYVFEREMLINDGYKMGFDYLPSNYNVLDRHDQNNKYMFAMWDAENDHLQDAMFFCEYGDLEAKLNSDDRGNK